jgi:hypothetical protein
MEQYQKKIKKKASSLTHARTDARTDRDDETRNFGKKNKKIKIKKNKIVLVAPTSTGYESRKLISMELENFHAGLNRVAQTQHG